MKEYAFDVRLDAVVRVKAENRREAEDAMDEVLDACDLTPAFLDGYNGSNGRVIVTEASIGRDPHEAILFEIDGVEV